MENIITPLIVGLIFISYLVADKYGAKRKVGFWPTFIISIAFSPIVGWIFAWAQGKKLEDTNVKDNISFKTNITYIAAILLLFIISISFIYIYNPKNILENIGLKPNPVILHSQQHITENIEFKNKRKEEYEKESDRLRKLYSDSKTRFYPAPTDPDMGYDITKQLRWDCEIKVDVKNDGKSGMVLVRVRYGMNTKEESFILERNQYRTLIFQFNKTIKNEAYDVEIQSLE